MARRRKDPAWWLLGALRSDKRTVVDDGVLAPRDDPTPGLAGAVKDVWRDFGMAVGVLDLQALRQPKCQPRAQYIDAHRNGMQPRVPVDDNSCGRVDGPCEQPEKKEGRERAMA